MAVLAILGANDYCNDTYPHDEDGNMESGVPLNCYNDARCDLLDEGNEFTAEPSSGVCRGTTYDCLCTGLGTNDPSFTILVLCALFFVVKLVIELYLIWCANYLCTQQFKQESKKICMYLYILNLCI